MNSYATMEYADDYFKDLLGADAWVSAPAESKQKALISATLRIDSLGALGGGYRGQKADPDQALEFPRKGQNGPPEAVKQACCQEALALIELSADKAAQRRQKDRRQGVAEISIGDVSESYVSGEEVPAPTLYSDMALLLLLPYRAVKGVYPIR